MRILLFLAVPLLLAQNGAVVEGTVANKVTHAGLPGVTIRIAAAANPDKELYRAQSDASGAFRIDGVPDGDYVAQFDAPPGFNAPEFWEPWRKPFHVAAGIDPVRLNVPITPLGSLRGRVLDPDGRPAPRVRVELFRAHALSGAILITDEQGRFSQSGLTSGAYLLRARPILAGTPLAEREKQLTALPPKPAEGDRWIWAPTYYPNTTEMSSAETIVVRDGMELSGYEIKIRSAPVYCLSGVVTDEAGRAAGGASLWLLSEIGWGTAEARVIAEADGSFEFPNVRAGEWRLVAELKAGDLKRMGFERVSMPRHDVGDLSVRVSAPFDLKGSLDGLPRGAARNSSVWLMPVIGSSEQESRDTVSDDGALLFEKTYPGRYRVARYSAEPGYYLQSILLGTRDVTGQEIDIAPGSPPLRIVYAGKAARLQGTVENGAGIRVIVIQADRDRYVEGDSLRVAVCDREGRFTVEGLRPTAYYAFAFAMANVESEAVEQAVFARGLGSRAPVIRLEEGSTANVSLKVIPLPE